MFVAEVLESGVDVYLALKAGSLCSPNDPVDPDVERQLSVHSHKD